MHWVGVTSGGPYPLGNLAIDKVALPAWKSNGFWAESVAPQSTCERCDMSLEHYTVAYCNHLTRGQAVLSEHIRATFKMVG